MLLLLAQLSAEDVGLVKLALSVMGTLFLGLIGWVAVYMRRGRELVDAHVTDIALLKQDMKNVKDDVRYLKRRGKPPEESQL